MPVIVDDIAIGVSMLIVMLWWKWQERKFINRLRRLHGKKIAVLGMKGAGKTRFYKFLQQVEYVEGQTYEGKYPQFTYTKADGTTILISEGTDIGGGEEFIPTWYEKLLEESDSIVFVFDLFQYDKDKKYQSQTNARLEFIKNHMATDKDILTLLTHIDQFGKKYKEAVNKFADNIKGKNYADIVLRNYAPVNMTESEQLRKIENKIFK